MISQIVMPPVSQTTDTVKLLEWKVEEGEEVKKGQPLCEVETDKVTMDIECFRNGTVLKIIAGADTDVEVGSAIAYIGEAGEKLDTAEWEDTETEEAKDGPGTGREKIGTKGQTPVTPLAGKLAEVHKIDINILKGSGAGGKIVRKDVEKALSGEAEAVNATLMVKNLARKWNIDLRNITGRGAHGLITRDDLLAVKERKVSYGSSNNASPVSETVKEQPLSQNQQLVARNLTNSKLTIPHYYITTRIFCDALNVYRESNARLSITVFFIHAAAKALAKFPLVNSIYANDRVMKSRDVNINVAIANGSELYAPLIKNVSEKSLKDLHQELKWLAAKVENNRLEPGDLETGTFTVSNLGMYSVDEFSAIINPPQVGIVAIGSQRKELYVDSESRIEIKSVCNITGSFDHRIINGSYGAGFLQEIKKSIEELH